MATAAESPSRIISDIIGPRVQLGMALEDIAERTGITVRRVRAYWNGEVSKPRPIEVNALRRLRDEGPLVRDVPAGFVDRHEFERAKAERDAQIAQLSADLARLEKTIALAAALGSRAFSREARSEMEEASRMADGA